MFLQLFLFSTEAVSLVGGSSYSYNSVISDASMISYQLGARKWLPPMSHYAGNFRVVGARNVLSNNIVYNYMHPREKANAFETTWIWICRFYHPAALYGQMKKAGVEETSTHTRIHCFLTLYISHPSHEGKSWQKHCLNCKHVLKALPPRKR